MVRSLCVAALEVRTRLEKPSSNPSNTAAAYNTVNNNASNNAATNNSSSSWPVRRSAQHDKLAASPHLKRRLTLTSDSPSKKSKAEIVASPETVATPGTDIGSHGNPKKQASVNRRPVSLFAPPPSARSPLLPSHVLEAFAQIQRQQAASRVGGMRNWTGGTSKGRVALV